MATNDKYDRQLRLWGAKGQRALGNTHVVLVGASAAGTETLKNLVLPGIGSFSVVDDVTAKVTKQDASGNFFLPQKSVATSSSSSKAKVAAEYLQELNPDVEGDFHDVAGLSSNGQTAVDWKAVFEKVTPGKDGNSDAMDVDKKLLVIASDLKPNTLISLSQACDDVRIPLVVVQSYGLIGKVRIQVSGKVALLDPKPTSAPPDLRLKTGFPAFVEMADSIDMTKLENHQHGHVPYPILLYKAMEEWKAKHDGKFPTNFDQKQEFKKAIQSKSRDIDKELNFTEAVQNSYLAYTERDIFIPENLDAETTIGKLYGALKTFMDSHDGRPPLNGSIPDMTASTDWYIQLQGIYKDQSEKDLAEMIELVEKDEKNSSISKDDIVSFCANVFAVSQMQTRSVAKEYQNPSINKDDDEMIDDWKMALMDLHEVPEHTPFLWYIGLRACEVFCQKHGGRFPGTVNADWQADIPLLKSCWETVVQDYQLTDQELLTTHADNICNEFTRYGNAEIHTIASVVGGVASQEAVKLITGQYVPLNNTYIYNGIAAVAGVYRF